LLRELVRQGLVVNGERRGARLTGAGRCRAAASLSYLIGQKTLISERNPQTTGLNRRF
jgi:hypothetical protein